MKMYNLGVEILDGIWYNCIVLSGMQIPEYRCAGPVQRSAVNHVRRGTEQH
nr:MAG TPA: hypothetical protein [Caudoviricetes sp.]DAZ78303.1 MAG TPA: hypothetical protein [Caudoviricetes sp.]